MKNVIFQLFTLALLLTSYQSEAQLNLGFKLGVNDATQKVNIDGSLGLLGVEAESRIGFNVGAFLELGENKVRFQPEINFSTKGSFRADSLNGDRTHKLSYIDIPLQVKWYIFDNDKFSAYGMSGLYFGLAMGGEIEIDGFDNVDYEDGGYKKLDVGLPLAVGGAMVVGEGKVFIEARYLYGVNKVQKGEIIGSDLQFNAKNRTTQFNAGYIMSF